MIRWVALKRAFGSRESERSSTWSWCTWWWPWCPQTRRVWPVLRGAADARQSGSTNTNKARMSFICHIHNYTEYNEEWNVFSAFNPSKCTHLEQWAADCAAPGEQSWTSCRSRDSNPQPWVTSGFKCNALSIRPSLSMWWWSVCCSERDETIHRRCARRCRWRKSSWSPSP